MKVTENLDEAKSEIATLKNVVSKMETNYKDLQLKQKDLEQDLKNCQQSIPSFRHTQIWNQERVKILFNLDDVTTEQLSKSTVETNIKMHQLQV